MSNQKERDSNPVVAGLGEVLWDIFPDGSRIGGAPANFAAHAAALGANVFLVSAVGNDPLGNQTIEMLDQLNVNLDNVSRNEYPTGTVVVQISEGDPSYDITKNVAWDFCGWNHGLEQLADSVDAVCFGTLFQRSAASRETTQRFLNATKLDCLRVFDVNLRQNYYSDEIIAESLKLANVVKLNEEELPVVANAIGIDYEFASSPKEILERFDLKMIALTCGSEGSHLFTPSGNSDFCAAVPVSVIDTVGAGDSFTAAVVIGMLNHQPVPQFHQMASQIAARVCGQSGAGL